jgi:hypothetical protein
MTGAALASFLLQLAEGIEEAYVAAFDQPGSLRTFVYGLRFADHVQLPERPRVTSGNRILAWIEADRTVAVVVGGDGECSNAVTTHVKSLVNDKP